MNTLKPAIDAMEANGPTPETDQAIAATMGKARIFMIASWVALALAAAMGTFQPGSAENTMSLESRMNSLR